jgi:hypothetical protein
MVVAKVTQAINIEIHLCLPRLALYSISAAFCVITSGWPRRIQEERGVRTGGRGGKAIGRLDDHTRWLSPPPSTCSF